MTRALTIYLLHRFSQPGDFANHRRASHAGAVNTGTTPKVQYAYSEMTGGANHSRLVSMTYPNGKVLSYNYTGALDAAISRLTSMSDSTGTLEGLDYLGLGTVVRRSHSQPGVDLTYIKQSGEGNGDAGDQYTGLDRFGRVVDQRWLDTSSGNHTDRFQYGYDRNSNRLYRENAVNAAFSELYSYESLDQLASFDRGTLNGAKDAITGTPSRSQDWTLDAQGNWSSLATDGTSVGRTHNKQNEITAVGANSLTYDNNGNLTQDDAGQQYVYDAWNRLVKVKDSGGITIASYEFDALTRRIEETVSGATRDLYYSASWQVLEERIGSDVKTQYVWSPVYIDALVLRDRDADANQGNGLEERLYVQQDANFNVTALIDTNGTVVERFAYDPYGTPTFLNATWFSLTGSAYGWTYLHQGGRYETVSGLYHFRHRELDPGLGRWLQEDPIGFSGGDLNLYRYIGNSGATWRDPLGLQAVPPHSSQSNPYVPFHALDPDTQREIAEAIANAARLEQQRLEAQRLYDEMYESLAHAGTFAADVGTSVIPVVGDVRDWAELISGYNLVTGEQLSTGERVVTFVASVIPVVPASWARRGWRWMRECLGNGPEARAVNISNSARAGVRRLPHHHIFPEQFRQWFADRHIDIDRFTIQMSQGEHEAIHRWVGSAGWNRELMTRLIAEQTRLDRDLTPREIWDITYRLLRQAGYRDANIVPFPRR